MFKFILKRLGYGIFTLWIIITIVFFLIRLTPGDPMSSKAKLMPEAAKKNFYAYHGLDKPLVVQYGRYLKNIVLHFDFGESLISPGKNILESIIKFAPASASYGIIAVIIQLVIGIPLGVLAAYKRETWVDQTIGVFILIGICLPGFVFAALIQYLFCVILKWFPVYSWKQPGGLFMPALALSLGGIAFYCKNMRNSTLSVIGEDYIVTAKAKGVGKIALSFKHILRNAMIPIVTIIPPQIIGIFTGGFIVERIFSIPGLGNEFVDAVGSNDYPMIMALTIMTSAGFVLSLIVVDILYSLIDPRIRISGAKK